MNVREFLASIRIDGEPVNNVLQVTIDEEKATIAYARPRGGADPAQRVITVESEAVTVG